MPDFSSTYDYIIVGAGSAGCTLASRLSADDRVQVLLVEAGGPDDHHDVKDPARWRNLLYGKLDWGWRSAPLRSCFNRIDHLPRAKMLGGCHSHNANAWVRGHPSDFDGWAADGCEGWSWDDVLPLFKKIEDWHGRTSDVRGTGGPMYVAPPVDPNPLATAFISAANSVGLPTLADINDSCMLGAGYFNLTIKNGQRFSVVDAYLRPALTRPNLTVQTQAETDRVIVEGARCVGVEFRHAGETHFARVNSEVILSAGVIGSPRILLLSGIGSEEDLRETGIPLTTHLPGVGRNLQDHPLLGGLMYECHGDLPPIRNSGVESCLWWKTDEPLSGPDVQPVLIEFPCATREVAAQKPHDQCYTICPSVVRPESRGSVRLTSADPLDRPIIDVNFLARDSDMRRMLAAVELSREIGSADAFSPFRKREVMPGPLGTTAMKDFIRNTVSTYFHPAGTCAMGTNDSSVVDPTLKVYGIDGLRIADASIMPRVTSGNTNAPTVMIGEKAAELIRGQSLGESR